MIDTYDDIINLPRWEPKSHKRMTAEARAAQFAPFAALSGHEDAINDTATQSAIKENINFTQQNTNKMQTFEMTLLVADMARADVAVTAERIYYRFATEDTLDDGDLPGWRHNHERMLDKLKDATEITGTTIPEDTLTINVSVRGEKIETLSEEGLRKIVDILVSKDDALGFLRGFVRN